MNMGQFLDQVRYVVEEAIFNTAGVCKYPTMMRMSEFEKISGIPAAKLKELCQRGHNPLPHGRIDATSHINIKTYEALSWLVNNLQPDGVIREVRK